MALFRVGYFQFRPTFGKVPHNLLKVTAALRGAEADLIVLPELPFTGYLFRDRDEVMSLAEDPNDSAVVEALRAVCRDGHFYIATGFTERRRDKCYNSALLIGPDGVEAVYRKLHLFNEEKHWFEPGDKAPPIVNVKGARVGLLICFDWAFPEPWRVLAMQGVEIVCHPCNLVLTYCQEAMRTRCLENGIFAVSANRYGADKRGHGEIKFTGRSQVTAPGGKVLHQGPRQKDELFIVGIDPGKAREKRITPGNDLLADRRPEFYRQLCQRPGTAPRRIR
jgi:predicted amidohydrolase